MSKMEICYIDMDDTLCDFRGAFMREISKNKNIGYPQSQLKFFENLEPIEGAIGAYHILKRHFDVRILTRPSIINPLCYMEKRLWVEKHLGFEECKNLFIAPDKTLLRGDYLIDDNPQKGLLVPEWKQILFGSEEFPDWEAVLKYFFN